MSRGETGKQRHSRIELGYYKRPDAIARWRARLILLALVLAGLWLGLAPLWVGGRSGFLRLFEWNRLSSPGPLARVHSTWESRCEACHVPFQPVTASQSSPQCQACHAGPPHHSSQIADQVSSCAQCHRDHRGLDASLVRMEDAACTSCHAHLNDHRTQMAAFNNPAVKESVTHFDDNPDHHPEFSAVIREDPGRLKFNHALHLAQGFTLENGGKPFTFAQVTESERPRYGWSQMMGLNAAVPALECASCHRLDGDEVLSSVGRSASSRSIIPARSAGAYMLPVTYENHCRACHPLEFDARSPGRPIRHGLSPAEVVEELGQIYEAQAARSHPDLLGRTIRSRAIPGAPPDPALSTVRRAVDDNVLTAVKILFGSAGGDESAPGEQRGHGRRGCVECHHLAPPPVPSVSPEVLKKVAIERVNVPQVWLDRALFDHSAHRAVDCNACHAKAKTSLENRDVLLPSIANCVQCHGPAAGRNGDARGGAGNDCTECHRYHNGDHRLQGKGASAQGAGALRTIEDFLNGAPKS